MSNYPPGVTGNEFEIAGPEWEGSIERTCDADILDPDAEEEEYIECGFEGTVEAWGHAGVLVWVCPDCETEHEEVVD